MISTHLSDSRKELVLSIQKRGKLCFFGEDHFVVLKKKIHVVKLELFVS